MMVAFGHAGSKPKKRQGAPAVFLIVNLLER
jgi:hypothetical protein